VALVCGLALASCGGDDGGADVDTLIGCLEDAEFESVEREDAADIEDAPEGLVDSVTAQTGSVDEGKIIFAGFGIFESAEKAEEYASEDPESFEQVESIAVIYSGDDSKENQAISCAEEATG